MTTTPSLTMSEAMVALKVSPCCVVALSRVWVMRMGRVVPGLRVMLRKAGAGGLGGGGGGSCLGGGGYLRGGSFNRCGLADDGCGLGFDGGRGLWFGRYGRWRRW